MTTFDSESGSHRAIAPTSHAEIGRSDVDWTVGSDFDLTARPSPKLEARGQDVVTRLRASLIERMVARRNRAALRGLKAMPDLWSDMCNYARRSRTTGCSLSDYLTLYQQVRLHKPQEVLELGTGISSVVLAHALIDNHREGAPMGCVTSMEEDVEWHQMALGCVPPSLRAHVELFRSPKVDGFHRIFRGVCYESIPMRQYDFVFSDGPVRYSPVNGDKLFNLDLIKIVEASDVAINAVVDNHYLTFYVLQKVFGTKLARYSPSHRLLFVGPVTKADLRYIRKENFVRDLRLFGNVELRLSMQRRDGAV